VLKLPDSWIWDSWYAFDGDKHHAFYLKASKGLRNADRRHRYTSVGHAVSDDLINWTVLPDALTPSDSPAFDSWTTWTGSVVQADDGTWWMFYTGSSREDGGDIQRIGAATSTDLLVWDKVSADSLVETDPTWYETLDYSAWHDQAWRDPWVFRQGNAWHMLITCRLKDGDAPTRGTIGHAISNDLTHWSVQPPLTGPVTGFGHLEVFQVEHVDGQWVLLWCCGPEQTSPELQEKYPSGGVFSAVGESPTGPFDFDNVVWFPQENLYAARLVEHNGSWNLIGFVNGPADDFPGWLSDPIPVEVKDGGIRHRSL
jgi:beta-fructofuranosidase